MELTASNANQMATAFLASLRDENYSNTGRGIVTCAGGIKYNTCAWVLIKLLRHFGCELPIEVWYLGSRERDRQWMKLVEPLGVTCVDAYDVMKRHPHRRLQGWPLKPYAILHSRFREVLFLDADNVPVRDPTYLFEAPEYRETGTVFWPDPEKFSTAAASPLWRIFGVEFRDGPDQESGQLLVDKSRCRQSLQLCNWYNEHADFYYQHVYGDKETFRFAWQRLNQPISWIPTFASEKVLYTLLQHDFSGEVLFQHRFYHKWSLYQQNPKLEGFQLHEKCLEFLEELRCRWSPVEHLTRHVNRCDRDQMREIAEQRYLYDMTGHARWPMRFMPDGHIAEGYNRQARFWWMQRGLLMVAGSDGRLTCRFRPCGTHWECHSRRDRRRLLRLLPIASP